MYILKKGWDNLKAETLTPPDTPKSTSEEFEEAAKILKTSQTAILTIDGPPKEKKHTFTKIYMALIGVLYFVGAMIGGWLVITSALLDAEAGRPLDSSMFVAYAAYLGGPTAIAIGFYAWKSKAENLLKIKNSLENRSKIHIEPLSDVNQRVLDTLANMKGEYV